MATPMGFAPRLTYDDQSLIASSLSVPCFTRLARSPLTSAMYCSRAVLTAIHRRSNTSVFMASCAALTR